MLRYALERKARAMGSNVGSTASRCGVVAVGLPSANTNATILCKPKRLVRQQRRHAHLGNGGKDRLHARNLDVAAAFALEQRRNVAATS